MILSTFTVLELPNVRDGCKIFNEWKNNDDEDRNVWHIVRLSKKIKEDERKIVKRRKKCVWRVTKSYFVIYLYILRSQFIVAG